MDNNTGTPTIEIVIGIRAYYPGLSMAEISRKLGISREWVRQILISRGLSTKVIKEDLKVESKVQDATLLDKLLRSKGYTKFVNRLNSIPKEEAEWLTGFWEGDGSLQFNKDKNYGIRIVFNQKDSRILDHIRYLLNLEEKVSYTKKEYTNKQGYHTASGFGRLTISKKYLVVPILFLLLENSIDCNRKDQLLKSFKNFKLDFEFPTEEKTPSLAWISGFFDAEGSFSLKDKVPLVSLSQSSKTTLKNIQKVIGGNLYQPKTRTKIFILQLRKKETLEFLPKYIKFSHNYQKTEKIFSLLREAQR